jgi:acyl carrier protein
MENVMTRDQVKQIVFDQFKKEYGHDLSSFDGSYLLKDLQKIDEKLDSLEVITFVSELEDKLKLSVTVQQQTDTIDQLIDFLYNNIDKK